MVFLLLRWRVLTARYDLSPSIEQITFNF